MSNPYPKLHNAAWPGIVGKEPGTDHPPIDLETMLDYTAAAEVDGQKFEGIDLSLFEPHLPVDATDDPLRRLAEKVQTRGLVIGSVVAPVWPATGGGSALEPGRGRADFLAQVKKACKIAEKLRSLGARPYGIVRIDSACNPDDWSADPERNQENIAETFRQACDIASDHGERLAAEGEICWGGMHSCQKMVQLLEMGDRPDVLGFQADMAHTLLYMLGVNAPEDRLLPEDFEWSDRETFDAVYARMTDLLRPWTIDFHIAQNDATVHGSGNHDKTGRHCLANDPHGKLDITRQAGYWLRESYPAGEPTRNFTHICWDGCMFSNEVMARPETWNDILAAMIAVRDAHGWEEEQ